MKKKVKGKYNGSFLFFSFLRCGARYQSQYAEGGKEEICGGPYKLLYTEWGFVSLYIGCLSSGQDQLTRPRALVQRRGTAM